MKVKRYTKEELDLIEKKLMEKFKNMVEQDSFNSDEEEQQGDQAIEPVDQPRLVARMEISPLEES